MKQPPFSRVKECECRAWEWDKMEDRERGTGNRERGMENRERGAGNGEQGTGNREQRRENGEQGTGNRRQGT